MQGIYEIKNIINNKRYIGSSIHIAQRFKEHKRNLDNNTHHSAYLQNAWNKYDEEYFEFNVVEELELDENCNNSFLFEREQYWIDFYNSYENGYNCLQIFDLSKIKIKNKMFRKSEDVQINKELLETNNYKDLKNRAEFEIDDKFNEQYLCAKYCLYEDDYSEESFP